MMLLEYLRARSFLVAAAPRLASLATAVASAVGISDIVLTRKKMERAIGKPLEEPVSSLLKPPPPLSPRWA